MTGTRFRRIHRDAQHSVQALRCVATRCRYRCIQRVGLELAKQFA